MSISDSRWILWPDLHCDPGKGFRACILIDGERGQVSLGKLSNSVDAEPPIHIGDTWEEAIEFAVQFNQKRGFSRDEQMRIWGKTMRPPEIKARYDAFAGSWTFYEDERAVWSLGEGVGEEVYEQMRKVYEHDYDKMNIGLIPPTSRTA